MKKLLLPYRLVIKAIMAMFGRYLNLSEWLVQRIEKTLPQRTFAMEHPEKARKMRSRALKCAFASLLVMIPAVIANSNLVIVLACFGLYLALQSYPIGMIVYILRRDHKAQQG